MWAWRSISSLWVALPFFALLFGLSVGVVGIVWATIFRLYEPERRSPKLRWLRRWSVKGLGVPVLLWALMNFGFGWALQPFMPHVQAAQNQGNWLGGYLIALGVGWFAISTYWAAMTLGWIVVPLAKDLKGDARADFRGLCWTSLAVMILPAILLFWCGGWMMAGLAAVFLFLPIVAYGPTMLRAPPMPPMYARAIAKLNFGKYNEAEWDIISELEKHENDFEGWMMLANLYATKFNDLNEAEQTILEICDQPTITPSQISIALHKLADWHLKFRSDPEAARRTLQVICDRLPGTHLARMAQTRMSQLPLTAEELLEQGQAHTVHLPALSEGAYESEIHPTMTAAEAKSQAKQLTERLTRNPNDISARERLARVFADGLGRADLGIEQLELLLGIPDQAEHQRAEWMSLIAAWEIKHRQDENAGRKILRQIISEFPGTAQAFAALQRLRALDEQQIVQTHQEVAQSKPPEPKLRVDYPGN
jgi:uncharacterized protein (DUF1499 family)